MQSIMQPNLPHAIAVSQWTSHALSISPNNISNIRLQLWATTLVDLLPIDCKTTKFFVYVF